MSYLFFLFSFSFTILCFGFVFGFEFQEKKKNICGSTTSAIDNMILSLDKNHRCRCDTTRPVSIDTTPRYTFSLRIFNSFRFLSIFFHHLRLNNTGDSVV